MRVVPDPARTYETFLPLGLPADLNRDDIWRAYVYALRLGVAPTVRRLQAEGTIGWYGFLIHDFRSGVPTLPADADWYVHLRVTLTPSAAERDLTDRLSAEWRWTRLMVFPDPPSLDRVDISQLVARDVRLGWALLGDFSEWVLRFVEAHDPKAKSRIQRPHSSCTISTICCCWT